MKNLLGLVMLIVGIVSFFVSDPTAITIFALYFVFAGFVSLMGDGSATAKGE